MTIFETNMVQLYHMSQDGYNERAKRAELRASTSRYLVVHTNDENASPIAFCHYRFDIDHASSVVYCYELQVSPTYQSKGIGSLLIEILEKIAIESGMDKVMATVFAFNEKSLAFFHKAGFVADETCPNAEQGLDYLILSKRCINGAH